MQFSDWLTGLGNCSDVFTRIYEKTALVRLNIALLTNLPGLPAAAASVCYLRLSFMAFLLASLRLLLMGFRGSNISNVSSSSM